MYVLDGHDAGGQFLRRALTLSALENAPVRLERVRGNRPEPGLANQHLAVLELLAAVCDAEVAGDELGAETIEFRPDTADGIDGGTYAVDVGTAGSLTLLIDALLPLASRLEAPLVVTATGGTDVAWSPPVDYLRRVKLPVLRRHGLQASLEVERRGFYPAGGGRLQLQLAPSSFAPLSLETRGEPAGVRVYSTTAAALADADVAGRQATAALGRLEDRSDGSLRCLERVETLADTACPGSVIVLALECAPSEPEHGDSRRLPIAGFSALGEPGKPAERVGEEAADAALAFLDGTAAVDAHLGDQVLDHLALAGGRVRLPALTNHVETSRRLLESFGYDLGVVAEFPETDSAISSDKGDGDPDEAASSASVVLESRDGE